MQLDTDLNGNKALIAEALKVKHYDFCTPACPQSDHDHQPPLDARLVAALLKSEGVLAEQASTIVELSSALDAIRYAENSPMDTDNSRASIAASIVSFIESKRAELRLFPDIWAADLASQLCKLDLETIYRSASSSRKSTGKQ